MFHHVTKLHVEREKILNVWFLGIKLIRVIGDLACQCMNASVAPGSHDVKSCLFVCSFVRSFVRSFERERERVQR